MTDTMDKDRVLSDFGHVTITDTINKDRASSDFGRLPVEVVLLIFAWLSLDDILDLLQASSELRTMFGSVPEYCNSIVTTNFGVENAFFDSQIVNGFLVPSRIKFESMLDYIHAQTFQELVDEHHFFKLKSNTIKEFQNIILIAGCDFTNMDQILQIYDLDADAYHRFFEGTPLYLLFLSAFSAPLQRMQKLLLKVCKGRGYDVVPESLYQAILSWTKFGWGGLENTTVALLPDPSSPDSKQEVTLADLPMTLRKLFNHGIEARKRKLEVHKIRFNAPYWSLN